MKCRLLLAIFSFTLLFAGCTRELSSTCATRTSFKCIFDLNPSGTDLFGKLVNKIDLYAFNESGLLVKHITQTPDYSSEGYTMSVDLPYGKYTAVMYGTVNGNDGVVVGMKQGDLTTALLPMTEGESRMSDMRLMLNSLDGNSNKDLSVVLHGMASNIEVTGAAEAPHPISFVRNTSVVELKLSGLGGIITPTPTPPRAGSNIAVRIEGTNKAYLYDNTLDMELGRAIYAPYDQSDSSNVLITRMSVLRLFKEQPMTLKIYDGVNVIWTLNLIDEIMKSPKYKTNEDLDREDKFVVNVAIGTAGDLTVIVNGWTTTTSGTIIY